MGIQPEFQAPRSQQVVDIQPVAQEERRLRLKRAYQEERESAQGYLPDFPEFFSGPSWPEAQQGFLGRLFRPMNPARGIAAVRDGIQRAALRLRAVVYRGQWVLATTNRVEAQMLQDTARTIVDMERVVVGTDENSLAGDVLDRQFRKAVGRIEDNIEHIMNEISNEARTMRYEIPE